MLLTPSTARRRETLSRWNSSGIKAVPEQSYRRLKRYTSPVDDPPEHGTRYRAMGGSHATPMGPLSKFPPIFAANNLTFTSSYYCHPPENSVVSPAHKSEGP